MLKIVLKINKISTYNYHVTWPSVIISPNFTTRFCR